MADGPRAKDSDPGTVGTTVLPLSPTAHALSVALAAIDDLRRSPALVAHIPSLGRQAIEAALRPPAPGGDPAAVDGLAATYRNAETTSTGVAEDLGVVARSKLPAAWRGGAGETAAQAVMALGSQMMGTITAYHDGAEALTTFATKLTTAQKNDASGKKTLETAHVAVSKLFGKPSKAAWITILAGVAEACHTRLTAALLRDGAADDLTTVLNQLAADAHARDIHGPGVDPLTAVVLANAGDSGPTPGSLGQILTPAQASRASALLAGMSPADRAAFDALLSRSGSPQEAAYLWKALSNGYTLDQIEQFDRVIHTHGSDPAWLSDHLNPRLSTGNTTWGPGDQYTPSYLGQTQTTIPDTDKPGYAYFFPFYSQQTTGDCVVASTVMARAQNDPVYMLGLTTGQGPKGGSNPGDDSPGTVAKRVQAAYLGNFHNPATGEDPTKNATALLNSSTGSNYHSVDLNNAADRQAVLPRVEAALDAGKPVPIDTNTTGSGGGGHQMMIIAAKGDELEIYNPWGYTEWVTKEQFVNGQIGDLTGSSPTDSQSEKIPYAVLLP
ncbi:WXG100 family type VII secretion target [Nocardia sp. alder85J]|uniref:WXG100 family type VII secretion target n=1 Tax=Nocardia sp. alder85J TaxID=2862949 RepID=UPI001CD19A49|nr:WXG100 family type VII secretion target [Nocardia sp. alder85J]MCX4096755.1 WXG100 family type VII secretion target [Nocardia sp. alder85J]